LINPSTGLAVPHRNAKNSPSAKASQKIRVLENSASYCLRRQVGLIMAIDGVKYRLLRLTRHIDVLQNRGGKLRRRLNAAQPVSALFIASSKIMKDRRHTNQVCVDTKRPAQSIGKGLHSLNMMNVVTGALCESRDSLPDFQFSFRSH